MEVTRHTVAGVRTAAVDLARGSAEVRSLAQATEGSSLR